jgi:tetratricopeptide (TPR) repeat protein
MSGNNIMKLRFTLPLILTLLFPTILSAQVIDVGTHTKKKAKGVTLLSSKLEPPMQIRTYEDKTNKEDSDKARIVFRKANKQFESRDLASAITNYRKAYKIWDHPRILFNMGITLALMSRPLEASKIFKVVLEYGAEPVEALRYKEAKEKWIELMGTLAVVKIKCSQSKIKVHIDGDLVATCPADKTITLNSGRHLVTAARPGYIGQNIDIFLPRGVLAERIIKLKRFEQGVRYKTVRRIPLKWTIIGASAAAILLAGGSYGIYKGQSDIDRILDENAAQIQLHPNETFNYNDADEKTAITYQNVGASIVGVGVGAAITAALLYIFKDKQVPITYAVEEETETVKTSN